MMLVRQFVTLGVLVSVLGLLTACWGNQTVLLHGQVIDAYTGAPVNTAQVTVAGATLPLDGDGFYQTFGWSASDTLTVAAPGYETTTIPLASHFQESSTPITITLDTHLRPTTLEGIVTNAFNDAPIEGATVIIDGVQVSAAGMSDASAPQESMDLSTTTDADGHYQLENLPEQFTLVISALDHETVKVEVSGRKTYDVALRPNFLTGTITDKYSNEPIASAEVRAGSASTTTDDSGHYRLEGIPASANKVVFSADGYARMTQQLERTTSVDISLRPDVLSGVLVDKDSDKPVAFATVIATEGLTSTAVTSTRFDNSTDGSFTLEGVPETGYLQVLAPGYRKAVLAISPGNIPTRIELEPFKARALYVKTSTAAYMSERMQRFYDLIDRSPELNALVIDLKSDNMADLGLIYYASEVPIIKELGTSEDLMDIRGILAETKKRNIYTIARIHVFAHDNLLAETKPEWAAQNINGCVPNENRKCNGNVFYADWDIAWLDPWNRNVWNYNIQLGIEAAQLGFDEVQFDYIRFPNDAQEIESMRLSRNDVDWKEDATPMYENIATLMKQAHESFNKVGAFFSVDIFGYAVWAPQANIGQNAALMSPNADYICPMVYPSHFWTNELGFENAAAHPYEIVGESLKRGEKMIQGKRAKMRPWLQDFTLIWVPDSLIVRYGVPEVRAQIKAVEDSPYGYGWAFWDPDNEYTLDAFEQ